jgi:hypothetical protein
MDGTQPFSLAKPTSSDVLGCSGALASPGMSTRAYGFPYDDVNDQSSVAILPNANPPSSLAITVRW